MKNNNTVAKDGIQISCENSPQLHEPVASATEQWCRTVREITVKLAKYRDNVSGLLRRKRAQSDEATARRIPFGPIPTQPLIDERTGRPYLSNSIRSSRYTIYDFIPKQLLFQCTRLNNFYFIVIGIPQAIPGFSTTGNFTTILPLLFFILLTIFKEGYDDFCRHRLDKSENNNITLVLERGGDKYVLCSRWSAWIRRWYGIGRLSNSEKDTVDDEWRRTRWRDVRVGDVVRVERDEAFPVDVVLLCTNNEAAIAFIETMALDGETNLKTKQAPRSLWHCNGRSAVEASPASFSIEQPNKDLYSFDGHVSLNNEIIPLTLQEVVLRGSILRNTRYAIGLVINTGEECKIRMNANHHPKAKKPHLERWSNYIVLMLIAYVVLLSVGCSIGYIVWQASTENESWYLNDAAVPFKQIIIGYGIMFNNVIPLALYVSLEIVKLAQMVLISSDAHMYDETTQQKMRCNTNTILENLGQVEYVLSDKTGTLTENDMVFKGFSVGGHRCSYDRTETCLSAQMGVVATAAAKSVKSTYALSPAKAQVNVSKLPLKTSELNSKRPMPSRAPDTGLAITDLLRSQDRYTVSSKAEDFLLTMALCHTCLPAETQNGTFEYQAASPDELALVKAASELGFILKHRSSTSITIVRDAPFGEQTELVFDILNIIEFSSDRKRMSIILRYPDGQIRLLTKGADSAIVSRLQHSNVVERERKLIKKSTEVQRDKQRKSLQAVRAMSLNRPSVAMERIRLSLDVSHSRRASSDVRFDESPRSPLDRLSPVHKTRQHSFTDLDADPSEHDEIRQCFHHLEDFATQGLRTLMYAQKCLTMEEYTSWKKLFSEANSSVADRQARIDSAAEAIEHTMDLVGVTAIEDRLQRDVPETVEKLRRANIRVWMLTGDKRETAISIAHSSSICCPDSLMLTIDSARGDIEIQLRCALDDMSAIGTHSVMVVDGRSFSVIESSPSLTSLFYMAAVRADSVICCRASPSQKAALVQGIRKHAPRKLTLTIGDGANDVAMIQAAHVGVGMMGREGMQAARVADYCIAQFSFLQRLLLVHGRWNYTRTAKFILNTFWKEMLFYLPQTLYQIHTGYSGSSLYENWSLTALNTLFTSLCVILPGIFEQDLRAETLLAVPELYVYGQKNRALNLSAFLLLMAGATIDGMIIWHLPHRLYGDGSLMSDNGAFALGHMNFSLAIIWTNWKLLLIDTHYKTKLILGGFFITTSGWWVWSAFLSGVYSNNISPFDVRGGFFHMFGNDPAWWATFCITLATLILVDLIIRMVRRYLVLHAWWPLWTKRDERKFQARELEAWQEIEHERSLSETA